MKLAARITTLILSAQVDEAWTKSKHGVYERSDRGEGSCPEGYFPILDEQSCHEAAQKLGRMFIGIIRGDSIPVGCIDVEDLEDPTQDGVQINLATEGQPSEKVAVVCGPKPAKKKKEKTRSNLNEKLTKSGSLVEEWGQFMNGFQPDILATFPVPARSDEVFYEDVEPPFVLRGGFFAQTTEDEVQINFKITNPNGETVFEKSGQAEGLFHFTAEKKGTYVFTVSNTHWMEENMVTFALGRGNETHIKKEHVEVFDQQIEAISRELRDIQTESTYLWVRQKSHMKAVENIHMRVFWFCVVEFLVLIAMAAFQATMLKGMLSDRRVL